MCIRDSLLATGVPCRLDGVDVVEARRLAGVEPDVVEDVELRLRGEERGVRDAGGLQVRLSLRGDLARVAAVGLVGVRVDDRHVDVERLLDPERVEVGGADAVSYTHLTL